MNKYELVYDLKEHLDTYSQTYDDYIMPYGEADMIYHYIEEKDKEIERLNNIINKTTKYVQSLSSKGRGCDIYEDIKQEILKELKGSDKDA